VQTRRRMLQASLAALPLGLVAGAGSADPPAPPVQAPGTLGPIRGVTITADDLRPVERAWTQVMGYRVIQRGEVPDATAASWGAPSVAGRRFLVLGPASGEPTFLRFVEQSTLEGYSSAGTFGWSTTEITVQNSDQLYERLKTSPFKVLHPPSLVPTYPYLRAMQAEGPAGERLNLTWITETRPDLAVAKSFVGRCFIVVQGGPDLPATLKFFEETFGAIPSPIRRLPSVELAVVPLGDGAKIEADQLPAGAVARARPPGGLPPGIAIVTFSCSSFDRHRTLFLKPPVPAALEPFRGRRAATIVGQSGELIELMDT
jgi:hypothetical protein